MDIVGIIVGAISMGMIYLYGSVGEIVTEKAGHLNLGIPGIMCMGTAGGCFGVSIYMNSLPSANAANYFILLLLPIIFAIIFAGLGGIIYAVLTVSFRANQNVVGLAITTFGAGFSQFFMDTFVDTIRFAKASKLIRTPLPFLDNLGVVGEILSNYGFLSYLAIIIAVVVGVVLKKTRVGLNLTAIGENPATADAGGINVAKYKYIAIIIGSAIAGLGGLCYVMEYNFGTFDNTLTIQSFGWIAIALVIFSMWKPYISIFGSIVFGGLSILGVKLVDIVSSLAQQELINMLPYVVTIVVLVATSIFNSKNAQPPASLGVNYFREER
ncbi:MAG: ABC transporter permease [Clostridia bacterium]|nr:ABC transporter permease [Clostridia bacterium]